MMKPISDDVKKLILKRASEGLDKASIAALYDVSISTVYKIVKLGNESGEGGTLGFKDGMKRPALEQIKGFQIHKMILEAID
jgi:transposase